MQTTSRPSNAATFQTGSTDIRKPARYVNFYQEQPSGKFVVEVEGLPSLLQRDLSPERMVKAFAELREMTAKDFGASSVTWGGYAKYAQYWPKHSTPWDTDIV